MRMTASWFGSLDPPDTRLGGDWSRPQAGSPPIVIPIAPKRAVVLEAVTVWPGNGGARRKVGATANLDSFCARQRKRSAGRDEETALRSNKETDNGKDAPTCRLLKRRRL